MRPDVAPGGFPGPPRFASETHTFIAFPYGDLQLKEFWTLPEGSTRAPEGTKQESSSAPECNRGHQKRCSFPGVSVFLCSGPGLFLNVPFLSQLGSLRF